MSRVAAIGTPLEIQGLGLAGALVRPAAGPQAVREAWRALPDDVTVVVLTRAAAAALGDLVDARPTLLTAVLP